MGTIAKISRWSRRHPTAVSWIFVALAFCMTIGFGVVGFGRLSEYTLPISTRIYLSFQLLTLDSGAVSDTAQVPWPLEIARWSGVVASVGTLFNAIVGIFSRRISKWITRCRTGHTVVIGGGGTGLQLATDLMTDGHQVTVIEKTEDSNSARIMVDRGAAVVVGDAREIETLKAGAVDEAKMVLVVAGNDANNIEILAAVTELCRQENRVTKKLPCYVHVVDQQLQMLAEQVFGDSHINRSTDVVFFDRFANTSRCLFADHPLDRVCLDGDDSRRVHLVIIGFKELGQALLKQALAIGHFANGMSVEVTVVDPLAKQKEKTLLVRAPELHCCGTLEFIDGTPVDSLVRQRLSEIFDDSERTVSVAICDSDPQKSLMQCMEIVPLLTPLNETMFVCLGEDEHISAVIERYESFHRKIIPFGSSQIACSADAIVRSDLDVMARAIHDKYRESRLADGDSEENYPALRSWEYLKGDYRDANREQADHYAVKLRALGLRHIPLKEFGNGSSRSVAELVLSKGMIERLAEAEHRRWCANRRLNGWRYGEERDNQRKVHPDLVAWDALDDSTREYDRAPIRQLAETLDSLGYAVVADDR